MPHGKTRGREVDGHNQIQLASGETALEELHEQCFLFWFIKPRRIEGRFVDINRFGQLSGQRRPKCRRHGIEWRDVAPKGIDNEDSLGRIVRRGERGQCAKHSQEFEQSSRSNHFQRS
jgi:hypothetical protein